MALTKVTTWMIAESGNQTPVAGSKLKVDYIFEDNSFPLEDLGGIWNTANEAYFCVSKEFTTYPGSAQFIYAVENNNSGCVGQTTVAEGAKLNSYVTALNPIAKTRLLGVTNNSLVGVEIDIEPNAGNTISSSSTGMYIVPFGDLPGPAMQISGGAADSFQHGILIGALGNIAGIGQGVGILPLGGVSMGSLINSNSSTAYSSSVINLANSHDIAFGAYGGIGSTAYIYQDTANALRITAGSGTNGIAFRNSTNTDSMAVFDSSANFLVNLTSGNTHWINKNVIEGASILQVGYSGGAAPTVVINAAATRSWNSSNSAMLVASNSSTGRSINASGTINASGADYAEYETKNATCKTVEKGQIIGFDVNGLITDKFDDAVSFAVKSTNPNLVGGDIWASLGDEPQEPVFVEPEFTGQAHPGEFTVLAKNKNQTIEEHQAYLKQSEDTYATQLKQHQKDVISHKNAVLAAKHLFENNEFVAYQKALAQFKLKVEQLRIDVDRIAYCGKVPVNVTGANVGDYIIPMHHNDGIKGIAVANPTFEQYQIAVGRVRRILADGRAEIVVKPI